ncbi:MAG TPA: hypothetical protein VG013_19125, partial [Gemmataceae bacterium]|nr:hypothetical protein [Gemmataceae bacterium]
DLERVVLRCLAKDPADRYPDAETVGGALAACSTAGDWGAPQAALWWQEIDQGHRMGLARQQTSGGNPL